MVDMDWRPSSQTGRAHLLLISLSPGIEGGALGVVTLEGMPNYPIRRTLLISPGAVDIIEVRAKLFSVNQPRANHAHRKWSQKRSSMRLTDGLTTRANRVCLARLRSLILLSESLIQARFPPARLMSIRSPSIVERGTYMPWGVDSSPLLKDAKGNNTVVKSYTNPSS